MKKFLKPFSLLFLGFSLLVAVGFLALYIATPILGAHRADIERMIANAIHQPVKIESSQGIWVDSSPLFILKNFVVFDQTGTQPLFKVSEIRVGFKIFASLLQREPILDYLLINGSQIKIQQDANNHLTVVGLSAIRSNTSAPNMDELINWLIARREVKLDNIVIDWQKPDGHLVHIPYFAFSLHNGWYEHHANLKFSKTDIGLLLQGYRYKNWQISEGQINSINLHAGWDYQTLKYIKGSIDANHLNIIEPSQLNWHFNNMVGHFLWRGKIDDHWFLRLTRLQFNLDGQNWVEEKMQINAFPLKKGGNLYTVRASDINLNNLFSLLKKLNWLSKEMQDLIVNLNPQGELKNVYLEYPQTYLAVNAKPLLKSTEDAAELNWKFAAEIHHLNINPWQKIPGVQQLTGYLQVSDHVGQMRLDSEKLVLTFPGVFRSPLFLEHAQADMDWQVLPTAYKINVSGLQLDNKDVKFKGDMGLSIPKNSQSPFVNLGGEFNLNPNPKISSYLPVSILKPDLMKWLDHAFPTMAGGSGTIILRGPIDHFPFQNKDGIFAVHTDIKDLTFNYLDGWPVVAHAFAKLNFDGPKISVFVKSANIFKTQIKSAYGEIPLVLKGVDAELHMKLNAIGDLRDLSNFISNSPLNKKFGTYFTKFKFDGDCSTSLWMNIPLENDDMPLKFGGKLDLSEAKITLPFKKLVFDNIMGVLRFTQDGIEASSLKADFLNESITANIQSDKTSQTTIQFGGKARIPNLQKALQLGDLPYVKGSFSYQAKLAFSQTAKNANNLVVTSNLKDTRVGLPAPFNKSFSESMPSQINIHFGENKLLDFGFNYGNQLRGLLQYTTNHFELERGNIVIGPSGEVKLPAEPGIWVTGSLPNFDLEEWKRYFQPSEKQSGQQKKTTSFWPKDLKKVSLSFTSIDLLGQAIKNVQLSLSRLVDGWLLGIDNANLLGNVTIPDDENVPWKLIFQKMYLEADTQVSETDVDPNTLPPINFMTNDFRYGTKQLGRVQFALVPIEDGLRIENLSARSPVFSFMANGRWEMVGKHHQTYLNGQINTNNLGEMLVRLGMPPLVLSKEGKLVFKFAYEAPPYRFSSGLLSGNFSLALDDGRIVEIGAEANRNIGLGELLNFFSFQIFTHLSEVSKKGFPFDVMRGNFTVKNGNIYTQDTYWEGPVARVAMQGSISLPNRNYDLYLSVTPYITSSLPVVATIAGGPVVGITTWVADKLLSKHVAKIMTYSYHMRGPWEKPAVVQVNKAAE